MAKSHKRLNKKPNFATGKKRQEQSRKNIEVLKSLEC